MIITSTILNDLENKLDNQLMSGLFDNVVVINGSWVTINDDTFCQLISVNEIMNLVNQGKIIIFKIPSPPWNTVYIYSGLRGIRFDFYYMASIREQVDDDQNYYYELYCMSFNNNITKTFYLDIENNDSLNSSYWMN